MLTFKKLPVLFLLAFLLSGCAREKDLLDEQLRKLCAVDGGIKIYEKVSLPIDKFNSFGEFLVPPRRLAKSEDPFFYDWSVIYLKTGNPETRRSHFKLLRKSDDKLLAESVIYSRRGGDFPGPWHDSSFSCPEKSDIKYIAQAVFVKASKNDTNN